ncbi:1-deoxy-D-xylulose-5-phosphate synthase [Erysipelotrichaceae bacterium]|nr:1-deoxy-D-xylulose-5-phosphate synthase [Erysipelotrichaceae bacterium]
MDLTKYPLIENISIAKLKQFDEEKLVEFSAEVRAFLTIELSTLGGHIGPNLGVVELTIALFRVFNSPKDSFFWDIGHQCYVQKIITGRADKFDTLRQYEGLSGFVKRQESEHDIWEAGHASTSLSGACGLSVQQHLKGLQNHIISIIGDGALSGGMALEALNHIGDLELPHIIILNDNNMSISRNVGALSKHINGLRINPKYVKVKKGTKLALSKIHLEKHLGGTIRNVKNMVKKMILKDDGHTFFETMNIEYLGPIDGHNLEQLEHALEHAKSRKRPILLHVLTIKGKGYMPAEHDDTGLWHGIGPYSYENGKKNRKKNRSLRQWSSVISETLERLAQKDDNIIAITPAMIKGSKLTFFAEKFPNRIFDVGIAEEHAMTFAAGSALNNGLRPFIAIYSTFLQRAYDQLLHDVARQNLHIIIGIDRCGFAGGDGETHHGIYDISLMRTIPNLTIMMGKDAVETQYLLYNAFYNYPQNRPYAIRYPRGYTDFEYVSSFLEIAHGSWEIVKLGTDVTILCFGSNVQMAEEIAATSAMQYVSIKIVNARFIKPFDEKMLHQIFQLDKKIITIEEGIRAGGFGSGILEFKSEHNYTTPVKILAIPDEYIEQGDNKILRKNAKIDENALYKAIMNSIL